MNKKIKKYMKLLYNNQITVDEVSKKLNLSKNTINKLYYRYKEKEEKKSQIMRHFFRDQSLLEYIIIIIKTICQFFK